MPWGIGHPGSGTGKGRLVVGVRAALSETLTASFSPGTGVAVGGVGRGLESSGILPSWLGHGALTSLQPSGSGLPGPLLHSPGGRPAHHGYLAFLHLSSPGS